MAFKLDGYIDSQFDFEKAVKGIESLNELNRKQSIFYENQLKYNFKILLDNYKSGNGFEVIQVFKFCKTSKTTMKLNDFVKKDFCNGFRGSEIDIEVSRLISFLAYFWQSVDYIEGLTFEDRVSALEQPGEVLDILRSSIKPNGVFYESFCHIVNRKYDGKFFTEANEDLSEFVCQAIGNFIVQMFFMIEQYCFLAENYKQKRNETMSREYLKNAFLIFKQMKSQLLGKGNLIQMLLSGMRSLRDIDLKNLLHWKTKMAEITFPILSKGADIKAPFYHTLTTLHIAAFKGHCLEVQTALERNLQDLNSADSRGFRPLHCAVLSGTAMVEKFLSYESIDVNAQCKAGLTPLHVATICNSIEVIKILLKATTIDVNLASKDGWTALHFAVSLKRRHILKELLKLESLNVNAKMFNQIIPLHIATKLDDKDMIKMLLNRGADIKMKTETGLTAANIAEHFNCVDALKLLKDLPIKIPHKTNTQVPNAIVYSSTENVANDIDSLEKEANNIMATNLTEENPEAQNISEFSANCPQELDSEDNFDDNHSKLVQTVHKNELESIKSLLSNIADEKVANEKLETVLNNAITTNNFEIFKHLLAENKTKITDRGVEKFLFNAAELGVLDIVQYLIDELDMSPLLKNDEQKSLLCVAIAGGNFNIAKYLIDDQGVEVISTSENCPLCSAISTDDLTMVKYFLDKGSDIFGVSDNQRPLLIAAEKSSLKVFEYLLENGASLDVKSEERGVFDHAAMGGNSDILRYLVEEKNYKLDSIIVKSGLSSFFQVARVGKLKDIKYFVEEQNFSLLDRGPMNGTILHEAAFNRNLDVIRYFVEEQGLDVKVRDENSFVPLFYAVQDNNLNAVKYFISHRKLGIHLRDRQRRSVLHIAAITGHLEVVRYLVEDQNANLNVKDNYGLNPLFLCAQRNSGFEVFKFLLDQGSDVSGLDADKTNILHFAARLGNVEVIKMLAEERGIDKNAKDIKGHTPLFYAALAGQFDTLKYLIDDSQKSLLPALLLSLDSSSQVTNNFYIIEHLFNWGVDMDELTKKKSSILHFAASLGLLNIIKVLVGQNEMNANIQDTNGQTPLFYAARGGHLEVVKYFVETEKADLELKDKANQTACSVVFSRYKSSTGSSSHFSVLEYLLKLECKKKVWENVEQKILHSAAGVGNIEIIKYLVETKKMDVNERDSYGQTPVFYAAQAGFLEAVQYFVESTDTDLNITSAYRGSQRVFSVVSSCFNTSGHISRRDDLYAILEYLHPWECKILGSSVDKPNILHTAAALGSVDLIDFLVGQKGFDINSSDLMGQTPLFYAARAGLYYAVVRILKYHKVDVNAKNKLNQTAIFAAALSDDWSTINWLLKRGATVKITDKYGLYPEAYAGIKTKADLKKLC